MIKKYNEFTESFTHLPLLDEDLILSLMKEKGWGDL